MGGARALARWLAALALAAAGAEAAQAAAPRGLQGDEDFYGTFAYSCAEDEANCCAPAEWPKADGRRFRCEKVGDTYPCAIKLGANSWTGSLLNMHLAAIFIEEFLGYPVNITTDYDVASASFINPLIELPEDRNPSVNLTSDEGVDSSDIQNDGPAPLFQWQKLENGDIDAILEIWPSGHKKHYQDYVLNNGTIVDAGTLGIEGKIGWFIPSWVVELSPEVEYWRNLLDPSTILAFKDSEPSRFCCTDDFADMLEKGRAFNTSFFPCIPEESLGGTSKANGGFTNLPGDTCEFEFVDGKPTLRKIPTKGIPFLAGERDWVYVENGLIRNLNLDMHVQFTGSEQGLIEAIDKSVRLQDRPILFYYWKPSAQFQFYDLHQVFLPLHNAECWDTQDEENGSTKVDCDYPTDILYKVYRRVVEEEKPDAALFFDLFHYASNSDQDEMLANLIANGTNAVVGKMSNVRDIACQWARRHDSTWAPWITSLRNQYENKIWKNEQLVTTYVGCECNLNGTRTILGVYNSSIYEDSDGITVRAPDDVCDSFGDSVYSSRWKTANFAVQSINHVPCTYVPNSSRTQNVIAAVAIVAVFLLIIAATALFALRDTHAVKAAHISTMMTFIFGAILLNLSNIGTIGQPTTAKCVVRVTFLLYGFFFFAGSLLTKQYFINALMRVKYKLDTRAINRKTLLLRHQATTIFVLVSIMVIIWQIIAGFTPTTTIVDDRFGSVESTTCPYETNLVLAYLLIAFVVLIVSCLLAQQTRHFSGLIFGEAKFMFLSSYNAAVIAVFAMAVSLISGVSEDQRALLVSILIAFDTLVTAGLIAGSRVYAALTGRVAPITMTNQSSPTMMNSTMVDANQVHSHAPGY